MSEIARQVERRDQRQVRRRMFRHHETCRGGEYQLAQAGRTARREFGCDPAAERETGHVEIRETEPVGQIGIMQHMIVDRGEVTIGGFAEACMVGNDHAHIRRELAREFEAGKGTGAVEEEQGPARADGMDDDADPADVVLGPFEAVHDRRGA
ncbi:hypothetical protein MesoLjLb_11230 [Mesorhizobium sp. L-8-3]|nr:hypothetical protein MesoLjLb_11230 [Mesorhizobium sp. L-8-3]